MSLFSLITDTSASEEAEVSLITKLKTRCGFEYTAPRIVEIATCPQMAVLMLYNTTTSYTFTELAEATGMDKKNTLVTVATLVKNKLLKGDDLTGAVHSDDVKFDLNLSQQEGQGRPHQDQIRSAETKKDEDKELSRSVEEDHRNIIQACIVRILKMRKTISHQQLMLEVVEQLSARFNPRVDSVKKCIGILMEKDYMRSSEEARDIYEYIA